MKHFKTKLTIAIYKEGKGFIAFCPALDLCAQGTSAKDVQKNFEETYQLFLEETTKKGTLEQVLFDCGWKKETKSWDPPQFVKNIEEEVSFPV